ncbi:hypothetical protein COHA_002860 [Chlorella ohadii]|uniref:Expansin-like EG45 domain-containing protein n=1 Tax=Chlorella ohadii TaxID=2649997 RepID=A0AAD5H7U5_9CHLO|nr:hypothetical protein COHA_002860 [Chlorella ohadii]
MVSLRSLLVALFCTAGFAAAKYSGDGTAYSDDYEKDSTGFNACGFGDLGDKWEKYFCALPSNMFEGGHCGRCVRVCGADSCVVAKVVDACASCDYGDIDLSKRALKKSTGYEWDRKAVTWSFVSCDSGEEEESPKKSSKGKGKGKKSEDRKSKKKCKYGRWKKSGKCKKAKDV